MAKEREVQYTLSLKDEATRIHKQFADAVSRDAVSISSAAKSAGAALGAMLSVSAATDFIRSYADAEAQSAKLAVALQNVGATGKDVRDMFEEQAQTLSKKTAIDDDEIRALQGTLVAMTGNVSAAKELLPAVLDLSRGMGISTDSAARMFAKTNEGAEGLSRLGIKIGDTNSELERTQKIAAEVEKRWGGMAAQWALTPEGQLAGVNVALGNTKETLGKILFEIIRPMLPAITIVTEILQFAMPKAVAIVELAFVSLFQKIVEPLALFEDALNRMGVTQSTVMQRMAQNAQRMKEEYAGVILGIEKVNTASEKTASNSSGAAKATALLSEKISKLKKELSELDPGTAAYTNKLEQLTRTEIKYNAAVSTSADIVYDRLNPAIKGTMNAYGLLQSRTEASMGKMVLNMANTTKTKLALLELEKQKVEDTLNSEIQVYSSFADSISQTLQSVIVDKFHDVLGEQNSVLEMFIGSIGDKLISWGAAQLAAVITNALIAQSTTAATLAAINAEMAVTAAAAGPAALAVNIASFGAAGLAAAGSSAAAAAAQLSAMGTVAAIKFHEGGMMGQYGQRIPLASNERPAILKVGETVRTQEQEAALQQGNSVNLTVNNYSPLTDEMAIKNLIEGMMRKAGIADVRFLFMPKEMATLIQQNESLALIR